jgi:hypothetical protein
MATEPELIDLLDAIGDRAPSPDNTLQRLALGQPSPARRRRQWVPIAAAIVAVAATVVVSAVVRGDGSSDGDAAGSLAPGPTVDRAVYSLPLDAYYASATQERTLKQAQFALVRRCAQAHGVAIPSGRFPAANPPSRFLLSIANNVRPLTLQQARMIGYDMYPVSTSASAAALSDLTPQQLEVVQGWSTDLKLPMPSDRFRRDGGCFGQANRTLLQGATPVEGSGVSTIGGRPGLLDDDSAVVNVYVSKARSAESSPEVEKAQKRWSACMAAHGYPGLHATGDAIGRAGAGGLRSASAKRQAVQDVRCKESTGFMTVWITSVRTAQNAIIAAHRAQLAEFKERLATRMANAAEALK